MKILLATIITVILVLCVVLAAFLDIPFILALLIALAVIGVGIYLFDKWASSGEPVEREKTIEYDIKTSSAKLYKRVGSNLRNMDIKQYTKTTTHYNPSKTIYTSVTVGGVTTGGFHQTDAYLSETSQGGSGSYYLRVKVPSETEILENEYIILKSIILTDELAAQASTDKRVKKFLKGNTLVLKHEDAKTELTDSEKHILKQAALTGDVAMQSNITQRAFLATQLTWQECYDIKDWISGDIPDGSSIDENGKKRRKHPSYCVHRDKQQFTCTCRKSKCFKKVCNTTSGCTCYKDSRG